MKKSLLHTCFVAVTAIILFAFKFSINVLPIGSNLPDANIKLKDIANKEITLNDAKKKNGLLVMFSCNTCPYVIKNQERTRDICQYGLQNNVGVILLNSNETQRTNEDSYDAMQLYAKEQKYKWYYAIDKNNILADAFGANRTPENFLFDKNMKLVYHGAIDDSPTDPSSVNRQHLKEAINEMLAGKEVSVKETRSAGCAIKRN